MKLINVTQYIKKNNSRFNTLKSILPFIILFIAIAIVHIKFQVMNDDENHYINVPLDSSYWNYIVTRYNGWSSRVLVELLTVFLLKCPFIIFKVLDALVFTSIAISLSKIFNKKKIIALNYLICGLVFSFPFSVMASAGWTATTVGYLWTFAAGLACFVPISNMLNGEKINNKLIPLYMLLFIFATDSEQFLLIAILLIICLMFYKKIIKKEKLNYYIYILFAISAIKAIFILLCPGNEARKISEIERFFPNYNELGIFNKVPIGINYTVRSLYKHPVVIYLTYSSLGLLTYLKKEIKYKIIATLFFMITMIFIIGINFLTVIKKIKSPFEIADANILITLFSIMLLTAFLILIYINRKKLKIYSIITLLAGIISQLAIAFTPTIYASGSRTASFLYFSLIIICIDICNNFINKRKYLNTVGANIILMDLINFILLLNVEKFIVRY